MARRHQALAALSGSILLFAVSPALAEPSAQAMADTCAGCHGTDGRSTGPATPNLAGMSTKYFIDSMTAFKQLPKDAYHAEDARPATIMNRIAKGYSDEQIAAMAEHFASLPVYKADVPHDAAKAEAGAAVYEDNCSACHRDNGSRPDDHAGILAGQWLPWMEYSREDVQNGHREVPPEMKQQFEKLGEADLEAVLHFFASQR